MGVRVARARDDEDHRPERNDPFLPFKVGPMNGGNAAANPSEIGSTCAKRRLAERRHFRAPFEYTHRMRIVTYRDLRPGRFVKPLERLRAALARGDFAAAGLKKLIPSPYWRGKLSDEARLLLQFAPYNGETVCLFLEVIADHAMKSPASCGAHRWIATRS